MIEEAGEKPYESGRALGRAVAANRARAAITQRELAGSASVSLHTLHKLEQGHVSNPGVFLIERLARALEIDVSSLLAEARETGLALKSRVLSLGYEGLTIDQFVSHLKDRGVTCLADVRLTPLSRKQGFSKTKLSGALRDSGIEYVHYRALGNPKENRARFAGPDISIGREIFRGLLAQAGPQDALVDLAERVEAGNVAMMCFERDSARCHRSVVLEELQAQLG